MGGKVHPKVREGTAKIAHLRVSLKFYKAQAHGMRLECASADKIEQAEELVRKTIAELERTKIAVWNAKRNINSS